MMSGTYTACLEINQRAWEKARVVLVNADHVWYRCIVPGI
jgi:hypothetical protein